MTLCLRFLRSSSDLRKTSTFRSTEESSSESESESSVQSKGKTAPATAAKTTAAPPPAVKKPIVPVKKKWEGEDEEESEPVVCPSFHPSILPNSHWPPSYIQSDWEESSSEEEEAAPAPTAAAPPKKKGTLKAKLAEKEAAKAAAKNGKDDSDEYDSDAVLDPREKARRDKERELKADLNNAADLLGAAALGGLCLALFSSWIGFDSLILGTSSTELDSLISFQPRTKEDFAAFSDKIIEYLIKRHQNKPLYHTFVEHHAKALSLPLKDVEVRKVASGLTTLANEKQKEQRDKASGKKKPKGSAKPALGGLKASARYVDTLLV